MSLPADIPPASRSGIEFESEFPIIANKTILTLETFLSKYLKPNPN